MIKKLNYLGWVATLVAIPALGSDAENLHELKSQLAELDQKVKILERRLELDKEVAAEKAKSTAAVTANANGITIRSADTNFVMKIRGYVQADGRFYLQDRDDSTDTFLLRRVRPILEGTVYEKYDYRLMLDFPSGGTTSTANNSFVQDAYLNARFKPWAQLQIGKMKEPVGLERLQSGANLLFVERGFPTQLLPNRDVGIQLHGDIREGAIQYAVGLFNGVADGGSGDIETTDEDKDIAARFFFNPFRQSQQNALRGLGFGVAGSLGEQSGALRTFTSPGQQRFFTYRTGTGAAPNVVADGTHWRLSPQAYYYYGPFGIFGEYAISDQQVVQAGGGTGAGTRERFQHTGWQLAASYFLTGEENSFKAVTPRNPFDPKNGGWGAWELAARVGQLDVDDDVFPIFANPDTSATKATSYGLGINWHVNKNVKFSADFEHTDFRGGEGNSILKNGENIIFTRAQISF